jgi:hypothetical protein
MRPTGSSWLASGKPPHVACACVTIVIVRSDRGYKVASACSLQQSCFGCIHDALLLFAWSGWPAVSDPKASSGLRIWKRGRIVQSIPSQPKVSRTQRRRVRGRILPSALRHRKRHTSEALRRDDLAGSTSTIARSSADAFIFRPPAKIILTICIFAFSVARTTREASWVIRTRLRTNRLAGDHHDLRADVLCDLRGSHRHILTRRCSGRCRNRRSCLLGRHARYPNRTGLKLRNSLTTFGLRLQKGDTWRHLSFLFV